MGSILTFTSMNSSKARAINDYDSIKLSCISCHESMYLKKINKQSTPLAAYYNRDNDAKEVFFDAFLSLTLVRDGEKLSVLIDASNGRDEIFSVKVNYDFNFRTFITELDEEALDKIDRTISESIEKFKDYGKNNLN